MGQRVSYAEALESAVCHGYIDGQKQAESEHYWLQRFARGTNATCWKLVKSTEPSKMVAGSMRIQQ